ncbi:MAG: TusE/DsrC/DsvC family sulfur relay protein [Rhodocyclales bacterium]|nr:TusE/DsrC/DsvC family sulfur relay protein [Rhodocyclales bacterium]
MGYTINGVEKDTDDDGYLLEADLSEEAVQAIAAEQGLALTDDHLAIINFLRAKYQEDGHTPNLRNMMKMLEEEAVIADVSSARLFELFPDGGAAKQGVKVAGLTKPFGKGGY